ncbi:lipolytic protein g-d-s-l family [Leptolyngbya sp. Heron Island J]|uniref:SGNH/GDSL hydrolase family protein n=1 Tax=Leptolyngbya sp. Heron Island J TaxID=1385935 RepID=UPI0003B9A269|nr:SGNH/GDSL hydrolase family protein [Leptolyngbya sp. Heron Island J]ESA34823.1 lipolytic protein g-d-s-l family [Leptolyngbya sp. Heron Island J]
MKVVILGLLLSVTGFLLIELALRLLFGFGNPPLYIGDDDIGYLLAPNQRVRRLGNLITINQYSMRSDEIEKTRPENTLRVFLIGDSIVNGNWWTDQSAILSALLKQSLARSEQQQAVDVLNASANSWGPRNELAYLQRFGTFESQIVMLVINTDDLFGVQPNPLQVGKDRSYPDKKPLLAVLELAGRFRKQPPIPGLKEIQNEKGDRIGKNLTAIAEIKQYVDHHNGILLLAMTPLKREVLNGPRDYEIVARQRVDEFVTQQHIPYVDFLRHFQDTANPVGLYRDHIHLSPSGNALVTQSLTELILQVLPDSER